MEKFLKLVSEDDNEVLIEIKNRIKKGMKQTAVEWLEEKLIKAGLQFTKGGSLVIEQAKEMEKQQIIDAYKFGVQDEYVIGSEQYYKETFNR